MTKELYFTPVLLDHCTAKPGIKAPMLYFSEIVERIEGKVRGILVNTER